MHREIRCGSFVAKAKTKLMRPEVDIDCRRWIFFSFALSKLGLWKNKRWRTSAKKAWMAMAATTNVISFMKDTVELYWM